MSQKKKVRFKILAAPDDLSEIKNKVKKFRVRKLRKLLVPAVLILLAVCGTYLLLKNQTYMQARTAREYPVDISDTSSYARFGDGIVRYNRDGVVFLNKKNEEQWIQPAQIQNPIIVVKDKAFAVADNGGNNIMVFTEEGLKGEIETTLPIEKIAVSDQGIVSAVLKDENSPKIISYDATGNILVEQKTTAGTTGYPAALELSDDGRVLAVSYLYTEGAAIKSKVVFYNFGETGQGKTDNIVSSEEYNDTVAAEIFFMGEDRSVVVGDNGFTIYKGKEEPQKEKEITVGQEIQSVFHSDQYIGFVLLNRDKSGYEVRLYNRLGDQVLNRDIPAKYDNVKIDGDEIIMFDGTKCCIVSATGIIRFNGDIKINALEMFRAPGLNRYYVMSVDELRVIYLTK
ncbi:MAG TPA: hypothetical protein H9780_02720 [Candidatus Mediterraneibacter merdavium]|nr:hypothetical protein [Candidatus Mediterraneibacter merdavium]